MQTYNYTSKTTESDYVVGYEYLPPFSENIPQGNRLGTVYYPAEIELHSIESGGEDIQSGVSFLEEDVIKKEIMLVEYGGEP